MDFYRNSLKKKKNTNTLGNLLEVNCSSESDRRPVVSHNINYAANVTNKSWWKDGHKCNAHNSISKQLDTFFIISLTPIFICHEVQNRNFKNATFSTKFSWHVLRSAIRKGGELCGYYCCSHRRIQYAVNVPIIRMPTMSHYKPFSFCHDCAHNNRFMIDVRLWKTHILNYSFIDLLVLKGEKKPALFVLSAGNFRIYRQ